MKIKSLILGMLSFAAVVACTQEQLVTPKLDVDKTEVSVEAAAGEATINVTSNVEWKATSDADWVSVDPSSGKGAEKAVAVKITADDNASEQARTATVVVEAGDLTKTVKVTQAGKSEEPGPEPGPEYTLDGKQWVFTWSAMNVEAVADLGVTQEGTIILAVDGAIMGMTGYVPYITGTYEVKPTDGTSGVVEFVDPADPSATKISISYKDLTETTVKFTLEAFQMVDVEAVAAAEKIEIGAGEPEPEPEAKKYLLVGDAVPCGWDPANGVVLTLKDGYYVAKGVEITAKKGMHFTLNEKWDGSIKGKEGLIRPNTIGEVGNNDISLTEGGKFDVYFAETLDKFYFMSEGKLPSEATEHEPIEVSWGVCGTLVGNSWGSTDDPVMTKEGEWYVAKGIQFESEINFKVRGNNSWADDVKWGVAVQDQVCSLNSAIAVSTCTEFKAANSGASDNPNIYIAAPVGEYDIYFSLEKKEVWVMNPGLKPGDDAPVLEETYTVTGTMTDNQWNNNGAIGLMTLEGNYYVAKNLPFVWSSSIYEDSNVDAMEFKICKTGTWDAYGLSEGTPAQSANTEIAVTYGGGNIVVSAPAGSYDVYFDKANGKLWVMTAGLKPGETEPQPAASEWSLVGSFNNWTPAEGLDLVEFDTDYYVYKGFTMESSTEFKFVKNKNWGGDMGGNGRIEPDTIQPTGGSNISVTAAGTYDVFLAKSLDKFYVMTPGKTPADATEPTPVDPSTFTWGMMGCFVDNQWGSDVPMTKEGEWLVAKNAQFTELTFKIRANASWADATNIGFAPGSDKGEINKAVAVVTAEYSKANHGGDAADIKLNGEPGAYDVYFNYEKLELWVMTPGTKPGETPAEKPYTIVAENVMEANEIIPYNESCLIVRGKDLMIYRMAYNSADGTFAPAELKADWSSYVTLWLAKGPGNYLHFGNMYDTWAVYNCGDDASTLPAWDGFCDGVNEGVIVGAASTYWPVRTGHPTGILGFLGDGQLLYYGLDDKARLQKQADGVTNVYAYTTGFNFAAYSSKSFCYGFDLVCVDLEGKMWLHTWDAATLTYSLTPKQIGSGWDKFTHLIPWGDDLLARDGEGNLYRYKFNLDNFWEVE